MIPDLASLLAHEMEPSLLTLEMRLAALMEAPASRDEAQSCLAEVAHLRSLLEDFLLLGRKDVRVEQFTLDPILKALKRRFRPIAKKKDIVLEFFPVAGIAVEGDPRATERALSNLVDNALKFCPEGREVRVFVQRSEAEIRVAVEDRGNGIPKEDQERIFLPFVRLDREQPGSGLGLSIARALAEAQGGMLTLESEVDRGSRFVLTLRAA